MRFVSSLVLTYMMSLHWLAYAKERVPSLDQSFFFWLNGKPAVPTPTAPQCEPLHITWGRDVATGPSPFAPYTLQVYTSAFVFPFIIDAGSDLAFDWVVPFAPGTQFQICMFDKNGNTGGCQMMYTVTEPKSTPNCANASFPLGPLDIDAQDSKGPLSQFGWVDQCSDISISPKNGTAPYIFTIAPSLRPPFNISINDASSPTNWTVELSWGSPFFVSVVDAVGNFWSYGPLHSGDGKTDCLDVKRLPNQKSSSAPIIGASIGGMAGGVIAGVITTLLFLSHRTRGDRGNNSRSPDPQLPFSEQKASSTSRSSRWRAFRFRNTPNEWHIEPFVMQSQQILQSRPLRRASSSDKAATASTSSPVAPAPSPAVTDPMPTASTSSPVASPSSGQARPADSSDVRTYPHQQVYVVHSDAGSAPVTVYLDNVAEVVELPPRYNNSPGASATGPLTNGMSNPPRRSVRKNSGSAVANTREQGSSARLAQTSIADG